MRSYFFSVLGWICGSFLVGIFIVGEGLIIFLPLSIILGPVGNLFGRYLLKILKINIFNPFLLALTSSSVFFLFILLFSLGLTLFNNPQITALSSYLVISWLTFWVIGGPIFLLIDFFHNKMEK